MDIHGKLKHLMQECGWTAYKLAKESGLSESTLANIFRRNTVPSISTLEEICNGFHITLSQFFAEGEMVELTPARQMQDVVNIYQTKKESVLGNRDALFC